MIALQTGIAYPLVPNQVYALPARAVMIASNSAIHYSQDGIVFDEVILTNGAAALASMFIRAEGIGTIVSLKEFSAIVISGGGSGGSGGELPTADLGKVLISKGIGIPPEFSSDIELSNSGLISTEGAAFTGRLQSETTLAITEKPYTNAPGGEPVGALANISDSNTDIIGEVITQGGTHSVLARFDGISAWRVVASNKVVSGGALPTAPLGQVLISQGVGVPPIFSDILNLTGPELVLGGVPAVYRDPANGTLILSGSTTANADSMIVIREKPLASFYSPSWVGTLANCSDSTVNTPGSVITGGGSFHVLARWDGTNWKVVA